MYIGQKFGYITFIFLFVYFILFVRALARGLTMTSCVVIPAGGVLTGLAAGESVVPLNCLVFFLPWWLYDANCRMDFKECARTSTANVESNVYIFFYESLS